jgi:hypothetical protein
MPTCNQLVGLANTRASTDYAQESPQSPWCEVVSPNVPTPTLSTSTAEIAQIDLQWRGASDGRFECDGPGPSVSCVLVAWEKEPNDLLIIRALRTKS